MNRVLIIEDSGDSAKLASRMCEAAKFHPREFIVRASLSEGLIVVNEEPAPDLVLLDLTVPPVGEDEAIEVWIPLYARRAPVVVWTGSINPDVVIRCHEKGAHSCLLKQSILMEKCGLERMAQAITDAILNWRREHGTR